MTAVYLMGAALGIVAVAAVIGVALLPMVVDVPEPFALLWSFAVGVEFMKINNSIWSTTGRAMSEPNPLPLVRQHLDERQHRRRCVAIIKNTRRPGHGHTDMALETYERFTATGEN